MFKWRVVANLTSSLGYDASCLGNHEFDDGCADLEAFSNAIEDSYPLLGTIHKLRSKHKLNRGRRRTLDEIMCNADRKSL
jgi:2',3'-cyclic-nucleotide 2'-phosphodiesterase (5'-nucleotidase family)